MVYVADEPVVIDLRPAKDYDDMMLERMRGPENPGLEQRLQMYSRDINPHSRS